MIKKTLQQLMHLTEYYPEQLLLDYTDEFEDRELPRAVDRLYESTIRRAKKLRT